MGSQDVTPMTSITFMSMCILSLATILVTSQATAAKNGLEGHIWPHMMNNPVFDSRQGKDMTQ